MKSIKKIDIHAHATLFPQYVPKHKDNQERINSAEEMIAIYDELNIEKGVLLPCVSPEAQTHPTSNEATKYIVDKYPDRFLWFCNVDPRSVYNLPTTDHTYLLQHYKNLGAKGMGEVTINMYVDDPMMENLLACCAEMDMPVTIHMAPQVGGYYGIVDDMGLPRLEKLLKKYPKLKILGHSFHFWTEITKLSSEEERNNWRNLGKVTPGTIERLMRECPNLYCDLSAGSGCTAMMRDPEYAAKFMAEFSDRIFYGCDICDLVNKTAWKFDAFLDNMVDTGALSMENYVKIVRTNAEKLLGL
ncbi:MAG: amidohydrolase family protein [Oscillospiraceae bacterium]|nr:amidohydrolase family protein [Oscillospiraceae bacterium]